jgi:hypothetical protein
MSEKETTTDRPCRCCGELTPMDGKQGTVRFGEPICRGCSDAPVRFQATCTNKFCSWSETVEGDEFNRGHLKIRIQQEANNHENRKRIFDDDPMHTVEINEKTDG